MGSVGSNGIACDSSNSGNSKKPNNSTSLASILGSDCSNSHSQSSGSAVSASVSASISNYKDIDSRLAALEEAGVEFCRVEIYRERLQRTGVGYHHGLLYHYQNRFAPFAVLGGPNIQAVANSMSILQIDWGQDGLCIRDVPSDHPGAVVKHKLCGLAPASLLEQIRSIKDREYNLLQWNCQHFSQHLYDQAGGNWHLNSQLFDLKGADARITMVALYERKPEPSSQLKSAYEQDNFILNGAGKEQTISGLVYWYTTGWFAKDPECENQGMQIEWVPGGLGFMKIMDPSNGGEQGDATFAGRARTCGLKPPVVKINSEPSRPRDGVLSSRGVDATPGDVKKTCMCQHLPEDILEHLREVESKAYQSDEWNSSKFATHMWERVLQRGAFEQLEIRLCELAQRGVVLSGLYEVLCQNASILHGADSSNMLVYKYVLFSSATDISVSTPREGHTIYLEISFNMDGITFRELPDIRDLCILRERVELRRARKANIKVELPPMDLIGQVKQIESRCFNHDSWNSSHFCEHLFGLMPGTERRSLHAT